MSETLSTERNAMDPRHTNEDGTRVYIDALYRPGRQAGMRGTIIGHTEDGRYIVHLDNGASITVRSEHVSLA